jgi:hypothetical protein
MSRLTTSILSFRWAIKKSSKFNIARSHTQCSASDYIIQQLYLFGIITCLDYIIQQLWTDYSPKQTPLPTPWPTPMSLSSRRGLPARAGLVRSDALATVGPACGWCGPRERELGLHLVPIYFWWLNCPTQIFGLTSLSKCIDYAGVKGSHSANKKTKFWIQ